MLVVFAAIVGLGWGVDKLFKEMQEQQASITVSDEITPYQEMGYSLASSLNNSSELEAFVQNWAVNENVISLNLLSLQELPLPAELRDTLHRGESLVLETKDSVSLYFLLPMHRKILVMALPKEMVQNESTSLQLLLTSFFYLGVLLVVLIWLYPLISRLRRLSATVKALGEGQLNQRIKVSRRSYISDIEEEFNRMAQQIATLIEDNKLLGNAVSHDLRTPLARLRFGIEALQETQNPKTQLKYQQHISRDIDEMEKLVEVLLNYARLDQAMISVNKQAIDLTSIASRCIESHSQTPKEISWRPSQSVLVEGDQNYLEMLINNLLVNALQYSASAVAINLSCEDGMAVLSVEDDGAGIPVSMREKVLKPFTRGEQDQDNYISNGYGMGLAIVTRIAQWHQAKIQIDESPALGGARISFVIRRL